MSQKKNEKSEKWRCHAPELTTIGLPDSGRIRSLAMGSEGPGRIDVLITHATQPSDPNEPVISGLYNRPSTTANFALPTVVETVSTGANYSSVQTLASLDGGLIAYWQQSDGITNELFTAQLGPPSLGRFTPNFTRWSQFAAKPHLQVELRNIGIAEGRQVKVEVFHGDPDALPGPAGTTTFRKIGSATFDAIDPLGTSVRSIPLDLSSIPAGRQPICVVVNRDSAIWEGAESNNKQCYTLLIPPRGLAHALIERIKPLRINHARLAERVFGHRWDGDDELLDTVARGILSAIEPGKRSSQ